MTNRETPPPVQDTNPPRRTRTAPPDDRNAVQVHQPPAEQTNGVTATVTDVGTNVGNTVPNVSGGPPAAMALDALLYGRVDPEADRAQTGVRLPRYVADAVRVIAATSRGKLSMQDVVTNAVKAYVPADVLAASWQRHGGQPGGEQ